MNALPIVSLEIDGVQRPYFADARLYEYRSVDGAEPWCIPAETVDGDMETIIAQFPWKGGA